MVSWPANTLFGIFIYFLPPPLFSPQKATKIVLDTASHAIIYAGSIAVNEVHKYQVKKNKEPSDELKATGRFFLKAASAMANVYEGVVEGAEIVVGDVATSTVEIAEHKYGKKVGETTQAGVNAVGSALTAAKHVSSFKSPTKLVVAVSTNTGQKLVSARASTSVQTPGSKVTIEAKESIISTPASPALSAIPQIGVLPDRITVVTNTLTITTEPPPYADDGSGSSSSSSHPSSPSSPSVFPSLPPRPAAATSTTRTQQSLAAVIEPPPYSEQ